MIATAQSSFSRPTDERVDGAEQAARMAVVAWDGVGLRCCGAVEDIGRFRPVNGAPTDAGTRPATGVSVAPGRRVRDGLSSRRPLARAALAMAVAVRGGTDAIAGVVFHTDQGSEYTARAFRDACERIGSKQSMGRVGSALDNAVIESESTPPSTDRARDRCSVLHPTVEAGER